MIKVSIIIPAHNEERRIFPTLQHYLSFFNSLKKQNILDFEIIVVLNACKDNTLEIVNKVDSRELFILNFKRGGKGFAVIEGIKDALRRKNDFIGFVDADESTSPEAYYSLLRDLANNHKYGGVIASRYLKNSKVYPKQTIERRIVSRVYNLFITCLLGLRYKDTQCGAKIFRKKALQKILPQLGMSKWAFDVDFLYTFKKNNIKIKEHATVWSDKEYSHINLMSSGVWMVLAIIRLRLLNSGFKWTVRLYDLLVNLIRKMIRNLKNN